MVDRAGCAIGIDIGGTQMRVGVVDPDGAVHDVARRPTPTPRTGGGDGSALVAAIADCARDLGPGLPVGIGIAALVDTEGRILHAPNLTVPRFWLGEALEAALGVPVRVGNDATLAGLAEHRHGAGRGADDMAMLTVGTGVGGALVVGGRLVLGASGLAAELGHLVINADGPTCACGQSGCLEAYASGSAIERAATEGLTLPGTTSSLQSLQAITGRDVAAAAAQGDAYASSVLLAAGSWLGIGMAVISNMLDPARIVVGGGAGVSWASWLLPAARASLAARLMGAPVRQPPDVVLAELGDDAGMIGAGILARDAIHSRPGQHA